MEILEINKDLIPYTFSISLADELFEFRVDFNETAQLFTVALSKDGKVICSGEPIVYGVTLFDDLFTRGDFPNALIIPMDESQENNAVTFDNLSSTVKLYVIGGDELE